SLYFSPPVQREKLKDMHHQLPACRAACYVAELHCLNVSVGFIIAVVINTVNYRSLNLRFVFCLPLA
ncbi:hypothetical protein, partial [Escherichia coli]|uniref:hypothetical protein n=1 Tax=Escherichia coli TaxID=562 RepID=UPI003F1EB6CF